MKKIITVLIMFLIFCGPLTYAQDMVLTGVYDGPLSGGTPKGVEIYVINDIADASIYGLGSANNGGGSDGEEFTFPADSYSAGEFIYVATEEEQFNNWFGFNPNYTSGAMAINGDDAVELFMNGSVIDVYGDINVDGTGEPWEFLDGWGYRVDGTGPDGSTFVLANFTYSGPNALDGETSNATAAIPFPTGTYSASASTTVATPVISPASGDYFAAIDVSMTCGTDGASIYYTLNGDDPTQSSTPYTSSFSVNATTIVKARAYKTGMTESDIATNEYTFPTVTNMASLADLRTQTIGDYFNLTEEVILTFQQSFRSQKFIQDATAAILIDDNDGIITTDYNLYDGITGITGKLAEYGGMLQFIPLSDPGGATSSDNTIVPEVITLDQIIANFDDYEAELVKIEGISFTDAGSDFENGTVYEISEVSREVYNFRTTFYGVDYIGTPIPSGSQDLVVLPNSRPDGEYITSRSSADIESPSAQARIVGNFQDWNTTDPDYVMSLNANNLMELTKIVPAGDNKYKVIEGDTWDDESFPGSDEPLNLSEETEVTWIANIETNFVRHSLPNVTGDYLSEIGGTDWLESDPLSEMEDPEGDEIYTLEVMLPAGDYECKVTLNKSWNQNTGDNTPFSADGYNPTTFTYDFTTNTLSVSVPPAPYITVLTPNGGELIEQGENYEITWEYDFWDSPIKIDLVKGSDELNLVYNIPVSQNSFSWGVFENQEIGDDYIIRISGIDPDDPTDDSDDYFSIIEPFIMPQIVISEIMYNPPESGNDSLEFLEFYNKGDEAVDFAGFSMSQGVGHVFPSVVLEPDTFLLMSIDSLAFLATFGIESLQWTSGALSNGGETVELSDQYGNIINTVTYDDQLPWDTLADGFGPSLEFLNPGLDNTLPESWEASVHFAAVNGAGDSIWASPGFGFAELSAAFEANETIVLVGDSAMFTDLSTGTPTSWMWTFEGGTPATFNGEMPPYITYADAGMWDVTLVVSDGTDTDTLTYEDYIWSGEMPVADFEAEETQIISGNYTNFTNLSTGDSLTYSWIFEGGTPGVSSDENPMEIYYEATEVTTYDVTLVVTNLFGSDTQTKVEYIEVLPVGISDNIFDDQSVSLYPNPTSGKISLSMPINVNAEYKILDINGRVVYSGFANSTSNIDLGQLNNGLYFMKLVDTESNQVVVKRILIK